MRAWLFQDHRQKQKLGDEAPWSVGWIDPEGQAMLQTDRLQIAGGEVPPQDRRPIGRWLFREPEQ